MSLLSLGMFVFSVPTLAPGELARRSDWNHPTNARVGARDASQFTGPGEDTISIDGEAYAELSAGRASLDQLRDMAESGDAWPLTDGTGRVHGAFEILAIDERWRALFDDGTPRRIAFSIQLRLVDQRQDVQPA